MRAVYLSGALVVLGVGAALYALVISPGGSAVLALENQPLPARGDHALLGTAQSFPSEGQAHVPIGSSVTYNTHPPTSGPHYDNATPAGFYARSRPPGELVHSLEHGAVVIYYDPNWLTPEVERSLKAFANRHRATWASVVVVPSTDLGAPAVLTSWTHALKLERYDPQVVRAFLAEYLGRGPENPVR